ncbi:MAG TPA: sulfatase-like hydrolase/transferase [Acidobacteriaceae bacterium]|nr:sulfatase-like hydrolase/transferase [Acidobacteriaceae bacterium]
MGAENNISTSQKETVAGVRGGKTDAQPWPLWQQGLESAGAALVVALPLLWLHLTPGRQTHYHELLPMNSVYQGLLIDFFVVVLVCRLALWLLERRDPTGRTPIWLLVAALLLVRLLSGLEVATWLSSRATHLGWIFLITAGAGFLLWLLSRSWYQSAVQGMRWVLVLLGFSIIWILPELAVMAFHPEPHETAGFTEPVATAPQRQIVWMLFDEASYDQIFDHRQPGVELPHFDALARTSVSFSDVQPAGYYTEKVIPSLLQGEMITQEKSDLDGRLFVKTEEHGHWRLYPDEQSLFGDARQEGWSTGVAGWFNPYCRIFARELDDCYWTLTIPLPGHFRPDRSAWQNAMAPLGRSTLRLFGMRAPPPASAWQMHTADYNAILAHAQAEIAGNRIGFLFIHLPVPHPGGIYNRKTHRIGVDGSYLDNLVLADETLGELLEDIRKSGAEDRTTVIVSSDHSWRIALWRPTTDWRPEDTRASGGRFDPRPLLMVHFPREDQGITSSRAFPLIAMHGMIEQMLAGRMQNVATLQSWVAQQSASAVR